MVNDIFYGKPQLQTYNLELYPRKYQISTIGEYLLNPNNMNSSKLIIPALATIVAIMILLFILKVLSRKTNIKNTETGHYKSSFTVWFATLFLSGAIILYKAMNILGECIDIHYKNNPLNALMESIKSGSLYVGLSISWFLLWYYVSNTLSSLSFGKRSLIKEIESDNFNYFLIRGLILIGLIVCLIPLFDIIGRNFMPSVPTPFYH